eukprot:11968796-Karenia_brevis.AAC.1
MQQMVQTFDEERVTLKSELVANQKLMQEMNQQMKALQHQQQQQSNVSSSAMDVSVKTTPQWFDMEAPGGVR